MAEKQFLTKKGYDERVALLENLKVVRRKEVAQKLKEAREQGDLSENAEYDAAKDEQRDIEAQIAELEEILKNAEIIQDEAGGKKSNKVKMESVVKLHDVEYDEDIEYVIVGSSEADSLNNKISNESPLGAALIGKKVGDTVKVEAPVGEIEYKIIEQRKGRCIILSKEPFRSFFEECYHNYFMRDYLKILNLFHKVTLFN